MMNLNTVYTITFYPIGRRFRLLMIILLSVIGQCFTYGQQKTYSTSDSIDLSSTKRIERLLSEMTLEEKVSQLTGKNSNKDTWSTNPDASFGTLPNKRLGIPGFEMGHGPVQMMVGCDTLVKSTCFPANIARAASWDIVIEEKVAAAIALELRAKNQNMTMAPTINICRDPRNGRTFEAYGEDPHLVSKMALAFVKGTRSNGIIPCPKHFVCNYRESNRFAMNCIVDDRALNEIYFPAYKTAIQEGGALAIMGAYNKLNGSHCCENKILLDDILRKRWGFKGLVLSDYHYAIHNTSKAVNAGLDIEMHIPKYYGQALIDAVREGEVSEADVDKLVRRVLFVKENSGLLDGTEYIPESVIHSNEHIGLSRDAAARSIVLLKNSNKILPLNQSKIRKISVVGPFKDVVAQGGGSAHGTSFKECNVTPLEGLRSRLGEKVEILDKVDASADVVLLFLGLQAESEGSDRKTLSINEKSERRKKATDPLAGTGSTEKQKVKSQSELIQEALSINPNTIVILFGGSAISMDSWSDNTPAIIMAWFLGEQAGHAITDILFGDVNPSAKLPITFPRSVKEMAVPIEMKMEETLSESIFIGYRYYDQNNIKPLFPFGHGLSYTDFEYSNISVKKLKQASSSGKVAEVNVIIKNTGKRTGAEVIQLYIKDEKSTLIRPEKELKAFRKIYLKPGEVKTVSFDITEDDLSFWDTKTESLKAENGIFHILIGASSQDIRVSEKLVY